MSQSRNIPGTFEDFKGCLLFPFPQKGSWLLIVAAAWLGISLQAQGNTPELPPEKLPVLETPGAGQTLYIQQYRIIGAKKLMREDVEASVYPFLGPGRTAEDVEQARAALEKAYKDKGYQTVSVTVPQQRPSKVILLSVTEMSVGRLRVRGSRYFNIEKIKSRAPSLAEGTVPNFNEVEKDIIALNQSANLQVTPGLKPGAVPGTVDVELVVKDKFPFHGSIELNNRYSANTTPLRLDMSARYDNLWQLGHTIGVGFQVAPERTSDALVYSGYYIAPVPWVDWLSVMAQGIRQNSNVSTLGGSAVAGNGEIYGGRLLFDLPSKKGFFQSASFGVDYKNFEQDLTIGNEVVSSPITYWPFVASYNGVMVGKGRETALNAAITFSFQGLGSDDIEFDNRRYNANGNFMYFRGSLSHTQDLPWDFQFFTEMQGQASATPLLDSEEFALGGVNTVRGYLEAVVLGDSAISTTFELRTPSLLKWLGAGSEWRLFVFTDMGVATINDPLPEQTSQFSLWSYGVGSNMQIREHLNGSIFVGVPLITQSPSIAGQPFVSFRMWGQF